MVAQPANRTPLAAVAVELPPELVCAVLEHTLITEGSPLAQWKARSAALRTYCVLSKAWKPWAQALLLSRVHLRTSAAAFAFLDPPSEQTATVTDLVVGGDQWEEARAFAFESLREAAPRLRDLEVAELEGLSLEEVMGWKELRRLTLRGLRVHTPASPRPLTLRAPHLTFLHLSSLDISPSLLATLLTPSNLPSLTTLALQSVQFPSSALSSIAPQIETLSLKSQEIHESDDTALEWTALRAYSSGWGMGLVATLKVLGPASRVRFLRVEQVQEDLERDLKSLVEGIKIGGPWVQGLEVLWLDALDPAIYEGQSDPRTFQANIAKVREAGVEVRLGEYDSFESWGVEMQNRIVGH
ncbi:hypothetical protein RQP46_009998 [Phenoliferia psychrophenolica]